MNSLTWKYIKPLSDKMKIETFELENGIKIPQQLKQCILENNGGRPSRKIYDTKESNGRVIKTLLSYNEKDIENIYKIMDILKNNDIKLLPFASDPSGNYICIDLKNDSVVLWLHELDRVEYVVDSFENFLEKLR